MIFLAVVVFVTMIVMACVDISSEVKVTFAILATLFSILYLVNNVWLFNSACRALRGVNQRLIQNRTHAMEQVTSTDTNPK
jgi:hypothetical protein